MPFKGEEGKGVVESSTGVVVGLDCQRNVVVTVLSIIVVGPLSETYKGQGKNKNVCLCEGRLVILKVTLHGFISGE